MNFKKKLLIFIIFAIVLFFVLLTCGAVINLVITRAPITAKTYFSTSNCLACGAITIGIIIVAFLQMTSHVKAKGKNTNSTRYGNRRFQTNAEIEKNYTATTMSLIKANQTCTKQSKFKKKKVVKDVTGILVKAETINKNSDLKFVLVEGTHAFVNGTTRSGKTQGYVSPQIQVWANSQVKPSFLVMDPKGELFDTSSKLLQDSGYNVMVINLAEPFSSKRYNPLYIIEKTYRKYLFYKSELNKQYVKLEKHLKGSDEYNAIKKELENTEKVTNTLKNDLSFSINDLLVTILPNQNGESAFWSNKGRIFLRGLLWGRLEDIANHPNCNETQKTVTFSQLYSIITSDIEELKDYVNNRPKTSLCRQDAGQVVNMAAETTRDGIITTAAEALEKINEEGIKYLTSSQDFKWKEVINKPTAFFIIIPDENKTRNVIASLLITQLYKYLIGQARRLPNNKFEKPFYFLLEELGTSLKIENLAEWLNISGGRNIWFILILQEISQLEKMYSKAEQNSILAGCGLKLYIRANEDYSAEYWAKIIGKTTRINVSTNTSNVGSLAQSQTGVSESEVEEYLLTPSQLKSMELWKGVFVNNNNNPCKTSFVPIYENYPFWTKGKIKVNDLYESIPDEFYIYNLEKINSLAEAPTTTPKPKTEPKQVSSNDTNDNIPKNISNAIVWDEITNSLASVNKESLLTSLQNFVKIKDIKRIKSILETTIATFSKQNKDNYEKIEDFENVINDVYVMISSLV
jgi:type IV secretion system protein VirD4